jgi:hypothetical protein
MNLRGNNNSPRDPVNSQKKEHAIPVFLERMISFLESYAPRTEGIFRLSASMMEINKLREQLDAGKGIELHEQQDKHVVACLLKLWLRELPESLIPHQLYTDLRNSFGSEGSYEDGMSALPPFSSCLMFPVPCFPVSFTHLLLFSFCLTRCLPFLFLLLFSSR